MDSVAGLVGMKNSGEKTDRKTTLTGYGDLQNLYSQGMNAGSSNVNAGSSNLGAAGSFYNTILSGNRQAVTGAMAPQIAQINSGQDATRRGLAASGTARGGGEASAGQTAHTQAQSLIDTSLMGARGQAAQGATQVGAAQLAGGTNLEANAQNAATNMTNAAIKSRPESDAINQRSSQEVGDIVSQVLGAAMAS